MTEYKKDQRVVALLDVNPEVSRYPSGAPEVEYEICRKWDTGTVIEPDYDGMILVQWDAMYNCSDFPMRESEIRAIPGFQVWNNEHDLVSFWDDNPGIHGYRLSLFAERADEPFTFIFSEEGRTGEWTDKAEKVVNLTHSAGNERIQKFFERAWIAFWRSQK